MHYSLRKRNSGFTLVELLVVIAIISLLVGLLLPAVQAAREAARMTQCQNNLKQISLAATLFHDTFNAYPPARFQYRPGDSPVNDCGGSEATWLVRILPYLEQAAAEREWNYSIPYSAHPSEVRSFVPPIYICPSRRSASQAIGQGLIAGSTTEWIRLPCGCVVPVTSSNSEFGEGALGDYAGNHGDISPGSFGLPTDFYYGGNGTGVIISSRATCHNSIPMDWIDKIRAKDITDGLSNTFLAGELHVPMGRLTQAGFDAFIYNGDHLFNSARVGGPTLPIVQNLKDEQDGLVSWGSWHSGVCGFTLADGSVRSIPVTIDTEVLGNLGNRSDGGIVVLPN